MAVRDCRRYTYIICIYLYLDWRPAATLYLDPDMAFNDMMNKVANNTHEHQGNPTMFALVTS